MVYFGWDNIVVSINAGAQVASFTHYKCYIGLFGTGLYMGRAPCTKETLPDFRERGQVTRYPRVFSRVDG